MMSGSNNQGGLPSMAMVSQPAAAFRPSNPSSQSLNSRPFTRENKDDLKCTFCGQTRHTEDTCFAKHGVPDWFPELKKKLRAKERGSGGNNGGRASLATAPPKAKEDETISNNPSQTLLTRSTHGDSSSTIGGDVTIEHRVESGTKPLLGESRQATIEKNLAVEKPCVEPSIPFIEEPSTSSLSSSEVLPNTSSLSSSEVPPNTSSLNMPEVSIVNDCVTNPSVGTYKLPPRQNRGVPPDRFSPEGKVKYLIANYVSCNKLAPERQTMVSNMESIHVPTQVEEALKDPKWAKAMDEEMLALQKNTTWEVMKLPIGKKTVGYYQETFSPVAKMNTVRVLISLAANMDWPLKQFDVKNAFLHGNLEEEVYMDFPPGYSNGGNTGVCRLRNDVDEMSKLQGNLAVEFEMKDLGDLKYFLEVEVARSSKGIFLSQLHAFTECGSYGCCSAYLGILEVGTGKGVLYRKNGHLRIEGFTDADWAGDVTDRRSTSGYFSFVGGNLVTWRSKKQKVVSRSSAEAEYRGMAQGICEILWLRKLLWGLGFKPKDTVQLFCDNKSARDIADNPVQHDRTKHVEVDRHFIKEKLEKKIVSIPFVESEGQLADVLTHAVCSRKFGNSLDKLGMCDIYAPT
ncbi:hypothetical protein L3X38_027272 [Prunus dulcis]|uniref:Reverse transcriptase Ty1/copia-type domain-containing protein n=1 Tax=Prunus dulcis TaxID=3755 RepID=A0AAD4Z043_PRUDU|nr:hypothetical protein L3X38_027272 [Prunus dulcis]